MLVENDKWRVKKRGSWQCREMVLQVITPAASPLSSSAAFAVHGGIIPNKRQTEFPMTKIPRKLVAIYIQPQNKGRMLNRIRLLALHKAGKVSIKTSRVHRMVGTN